MVKKKDRDLITSIAQVFFKEMGTSFLIIDITVNKLILILKSINNVEYLCIKTVLIHC